MSKLNQVRNFARSLKSKAVFKRGLGALAFAVGTSVFVIYSNHADYWRVTIFRTQSVDFNILAKLLPARLSQDLLSGNIQDLQENLDSNYGLFGMIITDCKTTDKSCPEQRIQYGSQLSVTQAQGQTKIESRDTYTQSWLHKLTNPEKLQENLEKEIFIPLYNPPESQQLISFTNPRDLEPQVRDFNTGKEVIGRLYFVRASQPSPLDELIFWLSNPQQNSSRNLTYGTILIAALIAGVSTWLVGEFLYYLYAEESKKRLLAEQQQTKLLADQILIKDELIRLERDLNEVSDRELQALVDAQAANDRVNALIAELNSLQADSEELINETIEEKEHLEKAAREEKEYLEKVAKEAWEEVAALRQEKQEIAQKLDKINAAEAEAERLAQAAPNRPISDWKLGLTLQFVQQVGQCDRTIQGQVLASIMDILRAPLEVRGNTIRILTRELRGKRRYRMGDYRIIFDVDRATSTVNFLAFGNRSEIYD
ncbi:hypothetical protein [Synechococcus elongatus]|uniref:hypothetical protein n=1 Tax=Synechococcus elongatus TaxID=32046 RepID=UPI0030D2FE47